jgi:hypothetical protein
MPFIGNAPARVPLTSADITDGIISSADIANGAITSAKLASGVGGKVLQVVSTNFTSQVTSSSGTFVDVSGFSATITPSSASNKILITVDCNFGGSGDSYPAIKLLRGSTEIFNGANGTGNQINCFISYTAITNQYQLLAQSRTVLDSPSTTSSTTYKIQFANSYNSPSYTSHINRPLTLDNSTYIHSKTSGITLIEIAG